MAWLAQLGHAAGRFVGQGIDLLYPPRCVFCRAEEAHGPKTGAVVCEPCRRSLTDDLPRCSGCGDPFPADADGSPASCRRCRRRPRFDGIVILAGYDDAIRSAVLVAKRGGGELHAVGLATLLVDRFREQLVSWHVDTVVPVPMHWLRRAARGSSSADVMARQLATALGIRARGLLWRTRATRMQNELPPEERAANVRSAFRATPSASGRRIVLVDDVMTTGATLDACRLALLAAGATSVHAAVIARADRGDIATHAGAIKP